jgi:predicted transcriptional regulator
MTEPALKDKILSALEQLPPGASLEDAIEQLCFLAKIERGLAQADAGQLIPHEEIVRRYSR